MKSVRISKCVPLLRWALWLAALVLVCGNPGQAAATLADTFAGNAQFIADPSFQPSTTVTLDAETSTCYFNGQYLMYFRSFYYRNGSGGISTSSTPTGIGLETSTDGSNFTPYNSGLPVIPNGSGGIGANGIYAPSVLVDNTGSPLKMVFEENPSSGTQRVAKAESSDGINWSSFAIIITPQYPWEGYSNGQIIGNVGTPSIEKFGSTYYVFYHGFTGVNQTGCLARGFASGPSLTSLTKCASNPVLRGVAGTWSDIGIGRGDIFQEGSYYYCVFEALKGSALCASNTGSGWGIAQSSDLVHWTQSSYNPVRIDRIGNGCGEDMPAWQVVGGQPYVVTMNSDVNHNPSVRRYKMLASARGMTTSNAVGMAKTPDSGGYWEVTADGSIYSYGDAVFYGSMGGQHLNAPIVGMAATPTGHGYWLVGSDGGIFTFGDAPYKGSMGGTKLNKPIVGIASTPSGQGYWEVASDGGIFTFGDAGFYGSTGGMTLNAPIVAMAATSSGGGYWLVGSDGGIFTFGNAGFFGSMGGQHLNAPIASLSATPDSAGYWMDGQDGGIYTFGDAPYLGSTAGLTPYTVVGMAPSVVNGAINGYWMIASDGGIIDIDGPQGATWYGNVRGKQ